MCLFYYNITKKQKFSTDINKTEHSEYFDKDDHSKEEVHNDKESIKTDLPYPKSVWFIMSNEFCERFSYYGMRSKIITWKKLDSTESF